jgi:hypothetical protein
MLDCIYLTTLFKLVGRRTTGLMSKKGLRADLSVVATKICQDSQPRGGISKL